jgi:ParB-like chromosome segregation protein Spo0J
VIRVPLDDLAPSPRNPRRHDLDAIEASIRRFGFVGAIVVDAEARRILAGHGRVAALRRLRAAGEPAPRGAEGWAVPAVVAPFAGLDAEALLVADNRTAERATWEREGLAAVLAELADADALAGTGYAPGEVEAMIARLTAEPAPLDLDPEGLDADDTATASHTLTLEFSAAEWPEVLDVLARVVELRHGGTYSAAVLAALGCYADVYGRDAR